MAPKDGSSSETTDVLPAKIAPPKKVDAMILEIVNAFCILQSSPNRGLAAEIRSTTPESALRIIGIHFDAVNHLIQKIFARWQADGFFRLCHTQKDLYRDRPSENLRVLLSTGPFAPQSAGTLLELQRGLAFAPMHATRVSCGIHFSTLGNIKCPI